MTRPIPVLLYHSVTDHPSAALGRYSIRPAQFEAHARVIAEQGWRVVTIDELGDAIEDGSVHAVPTLAVTFDDGFADTCEEAAPVLAGHGFRATLYVTTGTVGRTCNWLGDAGTRAMASWKQLDELAAAGWEIGAHSVDHPELDVLSQAASRAQIAESREALQQRLGLPIDSFAYPHGYHGARVRGQVVAAGYRSACAVKNAMSSAGDDPMARARLTVTSEMTGEDLRRLLSDAGTRCEHGGPELWRTAMWRRYRKVRHVVASAGDRS
jgi:peptidoglycan/xylan/chitin deacetylase (PgdA/CDA1 family)